MRGSLCSTNYLRPIGFLNYIKHFFKTTHTANLKKQYEIYRIRAFDLHIDFEDTGMAVFKYGGIKYESFSVYDTLNYLEGKSNIAVRLVLSDEKRSPEKEKRFHEYCAAIEKIYKTITFFGGYRETDKKEIYKFKKFFNDRKIEWFKHLK